jgi:hypothetical protein
MSANQIKGKPGNLVSYSEKGDSKILDLREKYEITSIEAFLYYNQNGKFSENLIDNDTFSLWNTIIGEGSVNGPATNTMVVVKISGHPGAYNPNRTINFAATTGGKTLIKMRLPIGIISGGTGIAKEVKAPPGFFYQAFWLYDTGCRRIEVKAWIEGQDEPSEVTKIINFECGE